MNYDDFEALQIERADGVVRITLNNPPLNTTTPAMHRELSQIFDVVARDDDAQVVVLTGSGDRGFSAGGDIGRMVSGIDDHARWTVMMAEARAIVLSALACDVPVIARINGHAIGFGATLALCADVTLMCRTAKIGDTHVKVGLAAGDGGALLWPHLAGLVVARRYLLSGDLLTADEAAAAGLVTEAVAIDALDAAVAGWVETFQATPRLALRTTKRALNMALRQQAEAFMDAHLGLETLTHLCPDHREAVNAIAERRPPVFGKF